MTDGGLTEAIFELFPEPIAIVGGALAIQAANEAWKKAFGEAPELLAEPALAEAVRLASEGTTPRAVVLVAFGGARHCVTIIALTDERAGAVMLHARALSEERGRVEQELRDQREFIRQVLDTVPDIIFVKDGRGQFLLVNRAFSEMFGKSPEEVVGGGEHRLHTSDELIDSFLSVDQQVIRTMTGITLEEQVPLPSGEVRWLLTRKRPLVRGNGEVHVLGSATDITERRQAAVALEEAAAELERRAAEAWRQAEAKAALVQELDQKLAIIEAQHQEILTLSAPLLDVGRDVLAVPIVGAINEARAEEIMARLLDAIVARQVAHVVLDVTGLETLEARTAELLVRIVRAIELLGARAVITGIRPAVAQMIVELGSDLSGIATLPTLRAALRSITRR